MKLRQQRRRLLAVAAVLVTAFALLAWRVADEGLPEWSTQAPTIGGSPEVTAAPVDASGLALPKKLGSLRFAVMGDVGRGDQAQYDTANEMARWHERFDFDFVLMLGDNIYAEGTPEQYAARFERPYKSLLDRGVVFQAVLGNHDPPGQTLYAPFNMNGNRYYSFKKNAGPPVPLAGRQVEFFALDTVTLDGPQLVWLRGRLQASTADWKIGFYHHPLYTSGRYRFSASLLRRRLGPIFAQYGLDVGFSGHEHFYERILPELGVQYFTSGGGGALRRGDLRPSTVKAVGFDEDTHFMLIEIAGDHLYFQAISRTGQTVDQGQFERVSHAPPPPVLRH
jgi:hypothetical protein